MGVQRGEIKSSIKRALINECSATFSYSVLDSRTSGARGLKGLRILKTSEQTNFAPLIPLRLNKLDPWDMRRRFNLSDFEEKSKLKLDRLNLDKPQSSTTVDIQLPKMLGSGKTNPSKQEGEKSDVEGNSSDLNKKESETRQNSLSGPVTVEPRPK